MHPLDGEHVRFRGSKTDQEGASAVRALPFTTKPCQLPSCARAAAAA
ncbi:hypothetical protein GFS60_07012 (plasmid) [Rhodococcus sp. WAY2]|nr:hypothetical protein GFS60_07012 [Rhodococcus sp. WAY2]